jgi:SNF2 family DNA or RNA helicase
MSNSYDVIIEDLDENYPQSLQPSNSKIRLWPHQLTLLKRCKDYENNKQYLSQYKTLLESNENIHENDFLRTQVGIIGDRVGSGKSFVVLALIADNDITNFGSTIKSYANNKVVLCFSEKSINIKTNLLVIPHNLISQWESYISAFSDNMKHMIISKMKHVEKMYENEASIPTYDLIVVTQTYYVRVAHFLTSRSFRMQRIIYDEVDSMNLPNCIPIDSNFYWFVTASYGNLLYPRGFCKWDHSQNRSIWYSNGLRNSGFIKDLFLDLFSNLSRDFVKILVIKNKDDYVLTSISLPPTINNYVICKTPVSISILEGFVDREVILSINAGDIASAMQRISPAHRSTEDNLIAIQIERYLREVNNYNIRIESTYQLNFDTEEQKNAEVARLTKKKKDFEVKIEGIKDRIKNTNTCCICYDYIQNKSIAPCCSNTYCFLCINIWLSKHSLCPLCKHPLCPIDLLVVDDNDIVGKLPIISEDDINEQFDKLKNLEIILKQKASNGKILIYSSYDMSFTTVIDVLNTLEIKYAYLKGNESHVRRLIERYKTEDLNVLLVNSRNYGSGLNLENTTDIVMFHKVESETEKQIIGRAARIGRTCSLNVWYLLYENEIRNNEVPEIQEAQVQEMQV